MDEEDELAFWQQPPLSDSQTFMSSIQKGREKILGGKSGLARK